MYAQLPGERRGVRRRRRGDDSDDRVRSWLENYEEWTSNNVRVKNTNIHVEQQQQLLRRQVRLL